MKKPLAQEKNYITPLGQQRLLAEYEQLWKVERPALLKTISWAAGNGDRSENADYIYGKRRLREIDRRVRYLQKRLELAVIVDNANQNCQRVQFGASVTVVDGETEKTYCIVGVDEVDIEKRHISWKSPLGQALLGKQSGDTVNFISPRGEVELEILKIEFK